MYKIGTLNVHQWSDSNYQYNSDKILQLLKNNDIDIIGLQETDEKPLEKFSKQLGQYNYIYNRNTAILSKYNIKNLTKDTKERYTIGRILLPNQQNIVILCLHLDYKYEPTRITQMEHIISKLELTKHPIVILGDFNALTKNDYSKKKWENIYTIRKENKWELPLTILTDRITSNQEDGWDLIDSRKIAKEISGPLTTCRFDTRIDYIYINKNLKKNWNIYKYECINAIPNITDHNLVIIFLKIN